MNNEINSIQDLDIQKYVKKVLKYKNRVKLVCNWTTSEELTKCWKKMLNPKINIKLVEYSNDYDYLVVINSPPPDLVFDRSKAILFNMEPIPLKDTIGYMAVMDRKNNVNPAEWNIDYTFNKLLKDTIIPKSDIISTVLSPKYFDPGHIKRIDFVKFLESKGVSIDVFGSNKWNYKNYKGSLPYHKKDDALFPYKYTFNVENNSCKNYVTEKLYDAIMSETLCFYSGCSNIKDIIDPRAYVYLDLVNFESDYNIIKSAIENDLWSERIQYIREAKKKIMNKLVIFAQIDEIIN